MAMSMLLILISIIVISSRSWSRSRRRWIGGCHGFLTLPTRTAATTRIQSRRTPRRIDQTGHRREDTATTDDRLPTSYSSLPSSSSTSAAVELDAASFFDFAGIELELSTFRVTTGTMTTSTATQFVPPFTASVSPDVYYSAQLLESSSSLSSSSTPTYTGIDSGTSAVPSPITIYWTTTRSDRGREAPSLTDEEEEDTGSNTTNNSTNTTDLELTMITAFTGTLHDCWLLPPPPPPLSPREDATMDKTHRNTTTRLMATSPTELRIMLHPLRRTNAYTNENNPEEPKTTATAWYSRINTDDINTTTLTRQECLFYNGDTLELVNTTIYSANGTVQNDRTTQQLFWTLHGSADATTTPFSTPIDKTWDANQGQLLEVFPPTHTRTIQLRDVAARVARGARRFRSWTSGSGWLTSSHIRVRHKLFIVPLVLKLLSIRGIPCNMNTNLVRSWRSATFFQNVLYGSASSVHSIYTALFLRLDRFLYTSMAVFGIWVAGARIASKWYLSLNHPFVQNIATISIFLSGVNSVLYSILNLLGLVFCKLPFVFVLKTIANLFTKVGLVCFATNHDMVVRSALRMTLLGEKLSVWTDHVFTWRSPDSITEHNISRSKSLFVKFYTGCLEGPVREELIYRYAFDNMWHVVGKLFGIKLMISSTYSGAPLWVWTNSIMFGLLHAMNWFPVRQHHVTMGLFDDQDGTTTINAWVSVFSAVYHFTTSFFFARFIFNPIYMERGVSASIGAHMALNAVSISMLMLFGNK